jgi:hypothetical protein
MRTNRTLLDDVGGLDIFILMARALTPPGMTPEPDAHWDRFDAPVAPAKPPPPKLGWMERLDRWFWRQRQRDLEAYLAQATDVHDLETRMRALERDFLHPYY